ncbi:MAG: hypothetical protein ABJE47_25290 [bacterium]
MFRARHFCSLAVPFCLACRDDPAPHVFHAPAPAPPSAVAPVPASGPDVPFGSETAGIRVIAFTNAVTGAPISLTDIRDSVDVLALLARGPGADPSESLRAQLLLRGACEGVLTTAFPAPAPAVIAHQFRLRVAGGEIACTRDGDFTAQVVLRGSRGRAIASSVPLHLVVHR